MQVRAAVVSCLSHRVVLGICTKVHITGPFFADFTPGWRKAGLPAKASLLSLDQLELQQTGESLNVLRQKEETKGMQVAQ